VKRVAIAVVLLTGTLSAQSDQPIVFPIVLTAPLVSYEDAPATPDADDPAIWVNPDDHSRSLVIGTGKDAGLFVFDLSGNLIQKMFPPNAPQVLLSDPPTPPGLNDTALPCPESQSGETFGRYNNVDIAYGVKLGHGNARRVDVAVVSDRGCDRVRFFAIDPSNPTSPLTDITSPDVARVFPRRYDQPSAIQSPDTDQEGFTENPLDDQNTVYGLTVDQKHSNNVFVTERERGLVRHLEIEPTSAGTLTYRVVRTFLFDTSFDLKDSKGGRYSWTPCREAVEQEPQSEGLVFDAENDMLYVAFETIGLYRVALKGSTPEFVTVGDEHLIEPVRSFGQAYHAIPDDDEFE
jgi:3-phytase